MYRFLLRPRWIVFTVVMGALVVVMVNLALWQLRRLDERQQFNRTVAERLELAPVAYDPALLPGSDPTAASLPELEWRQITVSGTYEPNAQVLIRDRSLDGAAGFNVVTPLRLADGRFLAVQRGWVDATATSAPAPPAGSVELAGRLRLGQRKKHSWEKADPAEGVLDRLNRVDIARLDQQVDGDAVPMYLELAASVPAESAVARIPVPERSDGPHLSYAVQWFLFSVAAIIGWVLAVRKAVSDRRKQAARGNGPTLPATPTPAADAQ
jgi:cytochrome oxidase assembly protein ShyY1